MNDFEIAFKTNVKKTESILNRLVSLKILTLLIFLIIIFIIFYGQLLTAIVMLILFLYQRALVNKFKKQVAQIKLEMKQEELTKK